MLGIFLKITILLINFLQPTAVLVPASLFKPPHFFPLPPLCLQILLKVPRRKNQLDTLQSVEMKINRGNKARILFKEEIKARMTQTQVMFIRTHSKNYPFTKNASTFIAVFSEWTKASFWRHSVCWLTCNI